MPHTATLSYRSGIDAHIRIQRLESALQRRRYPLLADTRGRERVIVLLQAGQGEMGGDGDPVTLSAPALACLPVGAGHFLRLEAGASGWVLGLSETLARDAAGQGAESIHLRYLLDRVTVVGHIAAEGTLAELEHAFRAIERELQRDERGSWQFLGRMSRSRWYICCGFPAWKMLPNGGRAYRPRCCCAFVIWSNAIFATTGGWLTMPRP